MLPSKETVGTCIDAVLMGGGITSPVWWQYFDIFTHILIFTTAVVIGIFRALILYEEYKQAKEKIK